MAENVLGAGPLMHLLARLAHEPRFQKADERKDDAQYEKEADEAPVEAVQVANCERLVGVNAEACTGVSGCGALSTVGGGAYACASGPDGNARPTASSCAERMPMLKRGPPTTSVATSFRCPSKPPNQHAACRPPTSQRLPAPSQRQQQRHSAP